MLSLDAGVPNVAGLSVTYKNTGGVTLGSTAAASPAVTRLRKTLNASYTDSAYAGATWQINLCDDDGTYVWSNGILSNSMRDANGNKKMWVVAQSNVSDERRTLVGLVLVRENGVIPSKYGLVAGGLSDDLGGTLNGVTGTALNGVLQGLLGTTPTVAKDPLFPAPGQSGVTGVRCGATDLTLVPISTCVAGAVGALSDTLPIVSNVLTGGQLAKFPTITTGTPTNIDQLRKQAFDAGTYRPASLGGALPTTTQACEIAGSPTANSIVFIEKVGGGDDYCVLNVPVGGLAYRAVIVGSGRIVIRGAAIAAGPISPTSRTFSGVVYALNRQRLPIAEGGQNLGDDVNPGREVVRIEQGAHVKGGVYADGKSAKVGIHPPITINNAQLRDAVCGPLGFVQEALCRLTSTVGELLTFLGVGAVGNLITGLLDQITPQRTNYGSAIVSDVNAIKKLTAYGASGVIPGTFRDLQGR